MMKLRYILIPALLLSVAFSFTACKKKCKEKKAPTWYADNDGDGLGDPNNTLTQCEQPTGYVDNSDDDNDVFGNVPSSFTKKVLLEEYTGSWCGYCPDAISIIHDLEDAHGSKLIVSSGHYNDVMEIAEGVTVRNFFSPLGTPSGCVDRLKHTSGEVNMNRGYWTNMVNSRLATTAKVGLAIDAKTTGKVEVRIIFKEAVAGDVRITVHLIEKNVVGGAAYNQSNYFDMQTGHEFEGAGNPIIGYKHPDVLRAVMSGSEFGDALGTTSVGSEISKNFTYSSSGFDVSNLYVIAFVNVYDADYTMNEVLNSQIAKVGSGQTWD